MIYIHISLCIYIYINISWRTDGFIVIVITNNYYDVYINISSFYLKLLSNQASCHVKHTGFSFLLQRTGQPRHSER